MNERVLGIDPGTDGGICCIERGRVKFAISIPLISFVVNKKQRVKPDAILIRDTVKELGPERVFLEELRPIRKQNPFSGFNMGRGIGNIEGVLAAIDYEPELIWPRHWTKGVWIERDKVFKKNGKVDTKPTSLNAFKRIFKGQESLLIPKGKRTIKDGIVDAALIAHYGEIYGKS